MRHSQRKRRETGLSYLRLRRHPLTLLWMLDAGCWEESRGGVPPWVSEDILSASERIGDGTAT